MAAANVDSSETPTPTPTPVDTDSNRNSTPTQEASAEAKTRRKSDPAWGYCTQFTEGGKKKIKCMFCNDVFAGGGIHRFKEHLAKYPGNVAACKSVDPEVQHAMFQNIEDWNEKKKKAQKDYEEGNSYGPEPAEQDDVVEVSVANANAPARAANRGKKRPTATPSVGKYFKPRTGPGDQPTIKSVLQGEAVKEKTDLCMARWFLDASIPFNASNSIFYQPMIDAVCAYGSGYKAPNFNQLRGSLLAKCVVETRNFVDGFRSTWREIGCTIMADGWTDRKRRTLVNFLVYCPKGTVFLKSVDATDSSKTADFLFRLFKDVVNFVGPENVVHFVTDNASNMVAAGRRSKLSTRNYDPISLDQIGMGNEAWILEDNPPRLNSEELNAFRTQLSALSIQCSDELVLDLDAVEADAMEDSDEIQDILNQERPRDEDRFDYGGIAIEVGASSPCDASPEPAAEDEWDPLNFE